MSLFSWQCNNRLGFNRPFGIWKLKQESVHHKVLLESNERTVNAIEPKLLLKHQKGVSAICSCIVQCISWYSSVYSQQCHKSPVHWSVPDDRCPLYSELWTVYTVHCTVTPISACCTAEERGRKGGADLSQVCTVISVNCSVYISTAIWHNSSLIIDHKSFIINPWTIIPNPVFWSQLQFFIFF